MKGIGVLVITEEYERPRVDIYTNYKKLYSAFKEERKYIRDNELESQVCMDWSDSCYFDFDTLPNRTSFTKYYSNLDDDISEDSDEGEEDSEENTDEDTSE